MVKQQAMKINQVFFFFLEFWKVGISWRNFTPLFTVGKSVGRVWKIAVQIESMTPFMNLILKHCSARLTRSACWCLGRGGNYMRDFTCCKNMTTLGKVTWKTNCIMHLKIMTFSMMIWNHGYFLHEFGISVSLFKVPQKRGKLAILIQNST